MAVRREECRLCGHVIQANGFIKVGEMVRTHMIEKHPTEWKTYMRLKLEARMAQTKVSDYYWETMILGR